MYVKSRRDHFEGGMIRREGSLASSPFAILFGLAVVPMRIVDFLCQFAGGDVDLDALLADLLEMENNVGSTSASPVKKGTAPAPVAKPAAAPMDEDEFTKLMAEMDLMGGGSSSSQPAPQRKVGDRKSAADLHGEISKLSGGAKVRLFPRCSHGVGYFFRFILSLAAFFVDCCYMLQL